MPRDIEIQLCSVQTGRQTSDDVLANWLGTFRRSLELRLSQLMERTPLITSRIHSPDIMGSAGSSLEDGGPVDLMLLVIAPGCFESRSFIAAAESFLEKHPDGASLMKVIAVPIHGSAGPAWLGDLPEFDLSEGIGKSYWARLGDLAYRLVDTAAREDPALVTLPATPASFAVYLAEVTAGLEREREMIRRVIERNGIMLLETHGRARPAGELEELVRAQIGRSAISIHMLDGSAGTADVSRHLPELELAVAQARCRTDRTFSQLIWLPLTSEQTMPFIEGRALQQGTEMAGEVDLLRISVEDLKTRIGDRIKRARDVPVPAASPAVESGGPMVYLMFDQRDADDAGPLREYLGGQGVEVILPRLDGDRVGMREHHQQSLRVCDAAMIYYGRVAEPWVRIKQQDLLKSAGFGRTIPMAGSAIFMGPEPTASKSGFTAGDVTIIRSVDGFQPESVLPFLETLQG